MAKALASLEPCIDRDADGNMVTLILRLSQFDSNLLQCDGFSVSIFVAGLRLALFAGQMNLRGLHRAGDPGFAGHLAA